MVRQQGEKHDHLDSKDKRSFSVGGSGRSKQLSTPQRALSSQIPLGQYALPNDGAKHRALSDAAAAKFPAENGDVRTCYPFRPGSDTRTNEGKELGNRNQNKLSASSIGTGISSNRGIVEPRRGNERSVEHVLPDVRKGDGTDVRSGGSP